MTRLSVELLEAFLAEHSSVDIADIGGGDPDLKLERTVYDLKNGYDVCAAPLPRQHSIIISMDLFEHILDPIAASKNIIESLAPKGWLFLTTVFCFEKHEHPIDTYRYTDTALEWLFRELDGKAWFSDEDNSAWGRNIRVSYVGQKRAAV